MMVPNKYKLILDVIINKYDFMANHSRKETQISNNGQIMGFNGTEDHLLLLKYYKSSIGIQLQNYGNQLAARNAEKIAAKWDRQT